MDQQASEIVLFFGRFHPLILHLPIGFLIIAFVLEGLSRIERFRQYKPAIGLILLLGAGSAVLAAALGYMLAQAGGYNEDLLFIHKWAGITLAFTSMAAFMLYRQLSHHPSILLDRVYIGVMSMMMISLSIAGHFGGSLTHGSDYLTQHMPNGLRKIVGLPAKKSKEIKKITNLNEAVVFEDIIYPILDARCISCHNDNKSKGSLMLHSEEAILKGGESGFVISVGDAEQSELIKRIHLPEIDEGHMPPKGKSQVTYEEVTLLTWWINEEASFKKTIAQVNVDEKVQAILNTLVDSDANKTEVEILLAEGINPADKGTFNEIRSKGVKIRPLGDGINWLQAKVPNNFPIDSLMKILNPVADQITTLDLSETSLTDANLAPINQFKNLTRLHLENTLVTDQGLLNLNSLKYVEYLNLYGTEITDEGIQQLKGMRNLKKLYLWQTLVSKKGVNLLLEALPELEVQIGAGNLEENSTL